MLLPHLAESFMHCEIAVMPTVAKVKGGGGAVMCVAGGAGEIGETGRMKIKKGENLICEKF